ncbi:RNA polymerase sigma factor, partial [Streptomyces bungoensis]
MPCRARGDRGGIRCERGHEHRAGYGRGRFLGQGGKSRRLQARDGELGAAVERAQDGDESAFAVAYRIVQPGLLGYLR